MTRFILSFLGGVFSLVTLGLVMGALTFGAVIWYYGQDLPDHESLSQYRPPTISRIYSTEGRIIDEYAEQRPAGQKNDNQQREVLGQCARENNRGEGVAPQRVIDAVENAKR